MSSNPCIDPNESIYSGLNVSDYVDKCQNEQHDNLFDEDAARELEKWSCKEYEKEYLEYSKSSS